MPIRPTLVVTPLLALVPAAHDVVSGWKNKLQSAIASVTPAGVLAEHIAAWPSPGLTRKPTTRPSVRWCDRQTHSGRRAPAPVSVAVPVSGTALLLIDVINDLAFDGSEALVAQAESMATPLGRFKRRAAAAGVPTIYINDNFGQWRSDFRRTVAHCTARSSPGHRVSRRLRPTARDYFVLKPNIRDSSTPPWTRLLETFGIRRVILTGIAGNICVLFTANDAYMREYKIFAPSDCIVSNTAADNDHALRQIATVLKGTSPCQPDWVFTRAAELRGAERRRSDGDDVVT